MKLFFLTEDVFAEVTINDGVSLMTHIHIHIHIFESHRLIKLNIRF